MMSLPEPKKVLLTDPRYPVLLREIPDAPKVLYYIGSLPEKSEVCIGVVGTRKATRVGLVLSRRFGETFARNGISVVSGLALGIDGASHKGALVSRGKTYAVLAQGLHSIYPRAHADLAREIIETGGGIISEYPSETEARPYFFLQRNRIVSGLCSAIVLIEAPSRSGALSTVRHALDQGREVFVVPGSPSDPNYAGSLSLIREGARLVREAEDVFTDMGISSLSTQRAVPLSFQTLYSVILQKGEVSLDELAFLTKIDIPTLQNQLTKLIIEEVIYEMHGKFMLK